MTAPNSIVLLTGATGFVGEAVRPALAAGGDFRTRGCSRCPCFRRGCRRCGRFVTRAKWDIVVLLWLPLDAR